MIERDELEQAGYKIVWIPLNKLSVIWVHAQRPYNEKEAQRIADNFDPELLDPIKVTAPNADGMHHVCDGQTRVASIGKAFGTDQMAPCFVSSECNPEHAAKLFLAANTRRRAPRLIDNFKVSVTAKFPVEVAIDKIVRHHGYRIDAIGPNVISAVGALKIAYGYSPQILNQTLRVLRATWDDDRNAVGGKLLRGFASLFNELGGKIDEHRLTDSIHRKKWTPGKLLAEAKTVCDMRGSSSAMIQVIGELLLANYNFGRKDKIKVAA